MRENRRKKQKYGRGRFEFVYVPEYIALPDEIGEVRSPVLIGNTVYFSLPVQTGATDQFGMQAVEEQLYKIGIDGTGFEKSKVSFTRSFRNRAAGSTWSISRILPADETHAWVCETGNFGYFDSASFQYISDTRSVLRKIELSTGASVGKSICRTRAAGCRCFRSAREQHWQWTRTETYILQRPTIKSTCIRLTARV